MTVLGSLGLLTPPEAAVARIAMQHPGHVKSAVQCTKYSLLTQSKNKPYISATRTTDAESDAHEGILLRSVFKHCQCHASTDDEQRYEFPLAWHFVLYKDPGHGGSDRDGGPSSESSKVVDMVGIALLKGPTKLATAGRILINNRNIDDN